MCILYIYIVKKEGLYNFALQWKLTQHCKAILHQSKLVETALDHNIKFAGLVHDYAANFPGYQTIPLSVHLPQEFFRDTLVLAPRNQEFSSSQDKVWVSWNWLWKAAVKIELSISPIGMLLCLYKKSSGLTCGAPLPNSTLFHCSVCPSPHQHLTIWF